MVVPIILFVAAVIQAFAGFGYAIFSIPLLLLLAGHDYKTAVVVCNVTFLLQSGIMTASVLKQIHIINVLTAGFLVPVGALLASETVFAEMNQTGFEAVFVCVFAFYLIYIAQKFLKHWPFRQSSGLGTADTTDDGSKPVAQYDTDTQKASVETKADSVRPLTWFISLLAGLVTGFIGALAGTTGPLLIYYSRYRHWDEEQLRIFLQPIFCWSALCSCVAYWRLDQHSAPSVALSTTLTLPSLPAFTAAVVLGTIIGLRIQAISKRREYSSGIDFRWYFYQIIRVLGVLMIVRLILLFIGFGR